jgi:hypothetical protein
MKRSNAIEPIWGEDMYVLGGIGGVSFTVLIIIALAVIGLIALLRGRV